MVCLLVEVVDLEDVAILHGLLARENELLADSIHRIDNLGLEARIDNNGDAVELSLERVDGGLSLLGLVQLSLGRDLNIDGLEALVGVHANSEGLAAELKAESTCSAGADALLVRSPEAEVQTNAGAAVAHGLALRTRGGLGLVVLLVLHGDHSLDL